MVKALGHEWDDDNGKGLLSSSGDNGHLTIADGGAAVLSDDLKEGVYSLTFEIDANDLGPDAEAFIGFSSNAVKLKGGKVQVGSSPGSTVDTSPAYVKRQVVFEAGKDTVKTTLKNADGVVLKTAEDTRANKFGLQLSLHLSGATGKILVVSAFSFEKVSTPQPPQPKPSKPPKPEERASYKGSSTSALAWAQDHERLLWDV